MVTESMAGRLPVITSVIVILALALAACAQQPKQATIIDVAAGSADPADYVKGTSGGWVDSTEFVLASHVRVFPQDGKLGLCALGVVNAPEGVAVALERALKSEKATMVLAPRAGADGERVVLPTRFIKVVPEAAGTAPDLAQAACVRSDEAWNPGLTGGNFFVQMPRMLVESRRRTQVSLGALQGDKR